jgi:hypothetical protein
MDCFRFASGRCRDWEIPAESQSKGTMAVHPPFLHWQVAHWNQYRLLIAAWASVERSADQPA